MVEVVRQEQTQHYDQDETSTKEQDGFSKASLSEQENESTASNDDDVKKEE